MSLRYLAVLVPAVVLGVVGQQTIGSVSWCSCQGGEQYQHHGDHSEQAMSDDDGDR